MRPEMHPIHLHVPCMHLTLQWKVVPTACVTHCILRLKTNVANSSSTQCGCAFSSELQLGMQT